MIVDLVRLASGYIALPGITAFLGIQAKNTEGMSWVIHLVFDVELSLDEGAVFTRPLVVHRRPMA